MNEKIKITEYTTKKWKDISTTKSVQHVTQSSKIYSCIMYYALQLLVFASLQLITPVIMLESKVHVIG